VKFQEVSEGQDGKGKEEGQGVKVALEVDDSVGSVAG
jgi:hypothetical protein